jgi:CPA2 family monovalent cation:H+ antiporter-2
MEHHVSFLGDLGLVLVVASVASVAFRLLKLPSLLGYLVAGLAVGPYIPIPIFADPARVEALAEFGVVLVMFSVGLEFSLGRLASVLPKAGFSAIVQMSGLALCGFLGGRAFGFTSTESLFLGAALSISSTMVVARVFDEQKVSAGLRDLVFGILVVQDLVAVGLITVLTAVAKGAGVSGGEVLGVLGSLLAVLVGMVVVGLLVVPRMVRLIVRLGSTEVMVVTALGLCFGFAILARTLGYSVALGAFIAGMLVAESGRAHRIETLVGPVRDLFAAVFFVSIGMLVDPLAAFDNIHIALAISSVVVIAQFATVTAASVLGGNGLRVSVRAGIYLGQIGEFSFIMTTIGTAAGVVDPRLLSIVVTVAALTSFTTPMLGRVSERAADLIDGKLPRRIQTALSLYERWFEQLRAGGTRRDRSRGRRLGIVVALDAAALVALTICASTFRDDLAGLATTHLGLVAPVSSATVLAVAVVASVPFALALFRSSKALAQLLAQRIVPAGQEQAADLGNAPRRLLTVAFQLIVLVAVGAPFVAVTVPFIPSGAGVIGFALIVTILALYLWRDANNLQGHVRAGAEVLIELLARQRANPSEIHDVEAVLPGLDGLHSLLVTPGTVGCGTTLAVLNLRAVTGATVLAIRRRDSGVVTPSGHETLEAGDLLALSGTAEAIELARQLLEQEKE